MEFSANNPIVQLCLQGIGLEGAGQPKDATPVFLRAWKEATSDHEKFLAAYYLARRQKNAADKLSWFQTALHLASKINDSTVTSARPVLYANIAQCHEALGNLEEAEKNRAQVTSGAEKPMDPGPFYHGTKADLRVGDLLNAGGSSNYKSALTMNHIYFTALVNGAALAATLAKGSGRERVYIVEPTGEFENDPNVTNNKFPGNPTRSYRSRAPLKIIGEENNWQRLTSEEQKKWREKLAGNRGEIIN